MSLTQRMISELAELDKKGLRRQLRVIEETKGTQISIAGRKFCNFSSNDYLGLSTHPALREAALEAMARFGNGATASRLICGTTKEHALLEEELAAAKKTAAALVFSTGYAASTGAIPALMQRGDVIILDKLSHASLIDGARASSATMRVFRHNDLEQLEEQLAWARAKFPHGEIMIVTESIFSMDGDAAPLAEIVELKEKYDALLFLDESHAVGVRGQGSFSSLESATIAPSAECSNSAQGQFLKKKHGDESHAVGVRGQGSFSSLESATIAPSAECSNSAQGQFLKKKHGDESHTVGVRGERMGGLAGELGLSNRIDIQMGTLGKAVGVSGGYLCGSRLLIDYLINRTRSFIYSTAPTPAAAAAARAAINIIHSAEGEKRVESLWKNIHRMNDALSQKFSLPHTEPTSAILPLILGQETTALAAAEQLLEAGFFVPAIRYPTVARGKARLRITLSALHEPEEIDHFIHHLEFKN